MVVDKHSKILSCNIIFRTFNIYDKSGYLTSSSDDIIFI